MNHFSAPNISRNPSDDESDPLLLDVLLDGEFKKLRDGPGDVPGELWWCWRWYTDPDVEPIIFGSLLIFNGDIVPNWALDPCVDVFDCEFDEVGELPWVVDMPATFVRDVPLTVELGDVEAFWNPENPERARNTDRKLAKNGLFVDIVCLLSVG